MKLLRKLVNVEKIVHIISSILKIPSKIINSLYTSIDRMYELSGYRIDRNFYKKFTLYSVYSIFALLAIFVVTAPFAIYRILVFVSISISTSIILFILLISVALVYLNALMYVYKRMVHFNERLIYTLSNMIPLIATRASLVEVFSRLYYFERDPEIKHELYLILKECTLGEDIITALVRSINRVPSQIYRDIISSLIEGLKVSQSPVDLLIDKLASLLERKRLTLKHTVTELTLFFQSFVILGLLAPAIVIAVYSAFSTFSLRHITTSLFSKYFLITPPLGNVFGISLLLALVYSPFLSLIFYLIFDSIMSKL